MKLTDSDSNNDDGNNQYVKKRIEINMDMYVCEM